MKIEKIVNISKEDSKISRGPVWAAKLLFGIVGKGLYSRIFLFTPIQQKRIVFISHKGKQYSCNPMYICEELLKRYSGRFEIIWLFDEPDKFSYLREKGITVLNKKSKAAIKALVTAKTVVTNVDTFPYLPKRKGQLVLDTWHGGGSYKTCGFANAQNLRSWYKRMYYELLYSRISCYITSSRAFTEETIQQSRHFYGEVLNCGMPRNDILVRYGKQFLLEDGSLSRPNADDPIMKKVYEFFGLPGDTKIALYAPTFRSAREYEDYAAPDFERISRSLSQRFGGNWVVLHRDHHKVAAGVERIALTKATEYGDMQELLYASDVLITDYSSSIWDMSLTYKPVFLYCPDLEKYTSVRNFYMPIKEWPFILCENMEDLEKRILEFDEKQYYDRICDHHNRLGNLESGEATRVAVERIAR